MSPLLLLVPLAALGMYVLVQRERDAGSVLGPEPLLAPAAAIHGVSGDGEASGNMDEPTATETARPGPAQRGASPADPSAAALAAARDDVGVVVYYTEWCGYCRALRSYIREHGIRAVELDIERDPRAKARQRQLNPRGGVPTIDVDGQVLVGFSPQGFERALERAARARLARLD